MTQTSLGPRHYVNVSHVGFLPIIYLVIYLEWPQQYEIVRPMG